MEKAFQRQVETYLAMVNEFLLSRENGKDFRKRYLDSFKKDQNLYKPPVADILMRFFDEVECYEPNPRLLKKLKKGDPDIYLDEPEIREKAREFVKEISGLLRDS